MLRALRAQVNAALAEVPVRRRPALRRSDAPDALLATDLPHAAEAETWSTGSAELFMVYVFIGIVLALGWLLVRYFLLP